MADREMRVIYPEGFPANMANYVPRVSALGQCSSKGSSGLMFLQDRSCQCKSGRIIAPWKHPFHCGIDHSRTDRTPSIRVMSRELFGRFQFGSVRDCGGASRDATASASRCNGIPSQVGRFCSSAPISKKSFSRSITRNRIFLSPRSRRMNDASAVTTKYLSRNAQYTSRRRAVVQGTRAGRSSFRMTRAARPRPETRDGGN